MRLPFDVRLLVGAGFVVAVGYGIVAPALPEYARSFNVGITAAAAVVSGFALVRLAFAPVSGQLIDRLGEQFVFSCGLLVVGASSAACAFARSYAELLIVRSLGGVGSTMFTVAAASLLIRRTPSGMRGRAMAAWATGFLAGTVAGPLVGGALIGISLRAPFLAYAGVLVVVAAVLGTRLREPGVGPAVVRRDAIPSPTFVAALRSCTYRAALTSNFLDGWAVFGIRVVLVPLFVVDEVARSGSWSGPALTAFAAGTVVTLPLGGHLADRWGRRPTVIVGTLIVAVTTLWLGVSTSVVELLIVCAVSGAGTGLMTPPVEAAVADVVADDGNRGGPALAAFQMVGDVGAIFGPVLGGWAVELGGYPAAFGLTALIACGSMLCWIPVSRN
ncbi:MFS transporter [Pseudonocardia charpentierae]|uniref:MFS transporter n=1 Tax=Pseudonocardia charpentierae TaxID=3075545 RepID=A0ABU2NA52_9PSEU|nr:MFS transporter [Pseudonocardia sp. DSM 45834]MDT0349539.1 MFS transporter [Pseudonocardia sp. DSM 45834]